MTLTLERWLPAPPASVWPFVTEPDRLNTWSRATIRLLEPGDGGAPGAVGALREVILRQSGLTSRLTEVIEQATPPSRLVYRVTAAPLLREHRGEVSLVPEREGTRLRWTVDYHLGLPGLDAAAGRVVSRLLEQSLAALVRVVEGAPPAPLPTPNAVDEEPVSLELWSRAKESLDAQHALAEQLAAANDPKRWFVRLYEYVTDNQFRACRAARVRHPAWVLRLIPRFHAYYVENLKRWMGVAPGWTEEHWRRAFQTMEQARDFEGTLRGLVQGAAAHVEEDLPRALAEVYCQHYVGRCGYARFRADYLLMGHIFREAVDRLMLEALAGLAPLHRRLLHRYMPEEVKRAVGRRSYDLAHARELAFARGERIAALMLQEGTAAGSRPPSVGRGDRR